MAKVEGLKEKLHWPLYDAFYIPPPSATVTPTFSNSMTDPRVIRFFVDIQNKTRLETNMQAAGTLPSLNSYEARAMRVVMSSLQPKKEDSKPEKLRQLFNEPGIMADLIYNSVTSLLVGEKTMIEMPTFGFPSGAGHLLRVSDRVESRHAGSHGHVSVLRTGPDRIAAELPRGDAISPRRARASGVRSGSPAHLGPAGRLLGARRPVTQLQP